MGVDDTSRLASAVGAFDGLRQREREWWALSLAAIMVASAVAGRPSAPTSLSLALAGALLLVTACSGRYGVTAVLSSAILNPWSLQTGTQTRLFLLLPLLAALAGGWLVRWLRRADRALLRAGSVRAVIAFAAVATTSFAVAFFAAGCGFKAPMYAQVGALAGLLLPAAAFLVAADELDRAWVVRLTWLFLILGAGSVCCGFVPAVGQVLGFLFRHGADGSLFWVWLVALASGQVLVNRRLHTEWRVALAWVVVLVFYLALALRSDWLAGWMPPLVGVAVVLALAAPRVAAVGGAVGALGVLTTLGWIAPKIASPDNLYSLSTRLDAWAIMWRIIAINPVLGLGPANYYHCTPLYPIRGFSVHFSSHNNYIDIVAETGVLGLLCLLWFAAACAAAGLRAWRHTAPGCTRAVVCGCLGGLAGTLAAAMLGDWWLPFVYNETLNELRSSVSAWIFLGALVALARETRSETSRVIRRWAWLVMICAAGTAHPAAASAGVEWSAPTLVFETAGDIHAPAMAVDPSDYVHVAWSVYAGHDPEGQYIYAAHGDGISWSQPEVVNIFHTANAPSLTIDPYAELHLIWRGALSHMLYARSVADGSAMVRWRGHTALAENNLRAQISADPHGRLHLLYARSGPMYRASDDGGATWSAPVRVARPSALNADADLPRLALSANGVLHVVWSELESPALVQPLGVFYARSTDGGTTWSPAVPLAGPGFTAINVAVGDDDSVHVAWNGVKGTPGRYHRRSNDGGLTWSLTEQIVAHGGADAPPQLSFDSTRMLHLITAYDAAVWHAVWDGQRWSEPECVSCVAADPLATAGEPSAVVAGGNMLHVVYWAEHRHQLRHTVALLAAPHAASMPVQAVGWWSDRFWHRDLQRVPALLGILASIGAVRIVRRARSRRGEDQSPPHARTAAGR